MKKNNNTIKSHKKLHIVIGTKAQLIKMAPIMLELQNQKIDYNFIFTGQHRETMDQLRENFSLKAPDITLHHGRDITGIFQMLIWLIKICTTVLFNKKKIFGETQKTDILLTHGDTFSTVLGALMGKLAGIKVAHIESGLRSFNIFHPFPEELNRLITFRLSDYYFCPGEWAVKNLQKYKGTKINTKLNTLYDSLQLAVTTPKKDSLQIPKGKYVLCSIHRFENIFKKDQFTKIIEILEEISQTHKLLFILHPPTKQQLNKLSLMKRLENNKNIELRPRYDYFDFTKLLNQSEFIITDGGSNQEEAFYLGKPCLLMRKATERQEGLGETTVISNYDSTIITKFVENYNQYKTKSTESSTSPTKIIIDTLIKNHED